MTVRLESVTFTSGDGETRVPLYLATPDRDGPHPVVLILRGVAGPDDGYTEIARRLAEWGYVALVHGWKVRGADPTDEPVYADLQGAMSFLGSVGQADLKRLAVFGFCRGGVHALMAARARAEIRVIVVFHGFAFRPAGAQPGAEPYDLAGGVDVPMLVLHGTEDERAPMADMRRMEARMRALGKVCAFVFYDGARHGFGVRTHPGYPEDAAKQSFDEAKRFLARYLPVARERRPARMATDRRQQIRLSPDEQAAFFRERKKAALATIDKDGFPHVVAMNYFARDGAFYMTSYGKAQKVVNIRRNPKVALMIEAGDEYAELRGVMIRGCCEILEDETSVMAAFEARAGTQASASPVQPGALASAPKRVVLKIVPEKVVSWDHRKLGGRY